MARHRSRARAQAFGAVLGRKSADNDMGQICQLSIIGMCLSALSHDSSFRRPGETTKERFRRILLRRFWLSKLVLRLRRGH